MKNLKVMSFNIRHGEGMDGKIDIKRIAKVIKDENADIVGLQEVDKNMPRSRLINQTAKIAKSLGFYYCYYPNVKYLCGRYGNGLISKYPIISSYNQNLISSKEPRGAIIAIIDLGTHKIKIINTHLGLVEAERLIEIKEIFKNINPDDRVVLLGDFNTGDDNPEIQKLLRKGLVDSFIQCKEKGLISDQLSRKGYTFAYKNDKPNVRIDYIFTSRNLQAVNFKVVESYCSDHFPVLAEIEID